jgi:hypothetical protein
MLPDIRDIDRIRIRWRRLPRRHGGDTKTRRKAIYSFWVNADSCGSVTDFPACEPWAWLIGKGFYHGGHGGITEGTEISFYSS